MAIADPPSPKPAMHSKSLTASTATSNADTYMHMRKYMTRIPRPERAKPMTAPPLKAELKDSFHASESGVWVAHMVHLALVNTAIIIPM